MGLFDYKVKEIMSILDNVKESCLYDEGLSKRVMNALNSDVLSHSDAIEVDSSSTQTLADLELAWKYAVNNFKGEFSKDFICSVVSKIEPKVYRYRNGNARLTGYDNRIRLGVNHAKINREMEKLFYHLNDSNNKRHPLIKAADVGLYGLIIHPFSDGNGRTFRLLQNLILYANKVPPVAIRKSEKMPYKMLISNAQDGFNSRNGSEEMFTDRISIAEKNYFSFMLDKMEEGVEIFSKKYANFRRYNVECYLRGNGKQLHGVREMLRRGCTAGGWVFKSTIDINNKSIEVITDAPRGIIDSSIYNHTKNKPWFKGYDVEMKKNKVKK